MEVGLPGVLGIAVLPRVVEECNLGFAPAPILGLPRVGKIALDHPKIFDFVTHILVRVSIGCCEKICMNYDDFLLHLENLDPAKNDRNIPVLEKGSALER